MVEGRRRFIPLAETYSLERSVSPTLINCPIEFPLKKHSEMITLAEGDHWSEDSVYLLIYCHKSTVKLAYSSLVYYKALRFILVDYTWTLCQATGCIYEPQSLHVTLSGWPN